MSEINLNVSPDYTTIDILDKIKPTRKMQKVPQLLRQEKNNQQQEYDPMVVSIGPYHHGKEELQLAEDFKIKCLELFVADSGRDKESLYAIVLEGVDNWRDCYIDDSTSRYDDQEFAQMMLLDACFIINYVLTDQKRRNRIVTINGLGHLFLPLIQRDLFLLENQVPFVLLEKLISMGYGQKSGKEMLCIYFNSTLYGDYNPNGIASSTIYGDYNPNGIATKQPPFHLLDAFRLMLVPTTPPEQPNKSGIINKICATLLENIAIFPSQWCKLRSSTTRKHQEEVGFITESAPRKPWPCKMSAQRKPLSCIESLSPPEEHLSCIESLSPPDKHLVEEEHKRLRPTGSAPRKTLSCIESLPLPDKDRVEEEYKRPSVGSTTRKNQEEVGFIVESAPRKPRPCKMSAPRKPLSCVESLSPPEEHLSCIESLPPPDKRLVEEEHWLGSAPRKTLSCIESLPLPDKDRVEEEYKRPSVGSTTRKHQEEVGFIVESAPRKPLSCIESLSPPEEHRSCIESLSHPDKHLVEEEHWLGSAPRNTLSCIESLPLPDKDRVEEEYKRPSVGSTTRKHQEEVEINDIIVGDAPQKPLSCIESLPPSDKHLVEEEYIRLRPTGSPPQMRLEAPKAAPRQPLSCIEPPLLCIKSHPPPDKHRVEEEYKRPSVGRTTRKHQEEVEINDIIVGAAPQKPLSCIESLSPLDKHHDKEEKYNAKKWVHSFRSASELKSRGIHFRPSKENSLMSIKFHPGTFFATLELPVWFVSMDNKVFFLNMIAYELCPGACTDQVVTAYIELMKKLIDTPKDVKELREQEILLITSGNDEDVVKVYKELNTYGIDSVEVFQKTKNDIQDHYGSKGKTWLAELIYVYFRTPWTVITLLAATVLLILTIIQTYFTIHPR